MAPLAPASTLDIAGCDGINSTSLCSIAGVIRVSSLLTEETWPFVRLSCSKLMKASGSTSAIAANASGPKDSKLDTELILSIASINLRTVAILKESIAAPCSLFEF
jgi:hypothetical protein